MAAVSADHIVPLARIIHMDNFTKLSPESIWAVVNSPRNLQWLSFKANQKKASKSVINIADFDPAFRVSQKTLEDARAAELQDLINKLVRSQG